MNDSEHNLRDPTELGRHPLNQEIYGDLTLEPDFLESIDQHGILEPILTKSGGTIVSGHRRHSAALELDIDEVPVREVAFDSELEEREAVIHHNKQRTKTFSQKMREAMELEEIERERAKQRQGTRTDIKQTFASSEFGQTREIVASDLDMSHETYRKAKKIWEVKEDGVEVMEKEVEKIDSGAQSIHGAYEVLKRWEEIQDLDGAVEWEDVRKSGPDDIGKRSNTFRDSKQNLPQDGTWTESLSYLLDEYENRWGKAEQGDVFVFSYMLEESGNVDFSDDATDPDSFTDRQPDRDTLFALYWEEGRELLELAVRFGVDIALIKHWMFELDVPIRKQDLTQAQQDAI